MPPAAPSFSWATRICVPLIKTQVFQLKKGKSSKTGQCGALARLTAFSFKMKNMHFKNPGWLMLFYFKAELLTSASNYLSTFAKVQIDNYILVALLHLSPDVKDDGQQENDS